MKPIFFLVVPIFSLLFVKNTFGAFSWEKLSLDEIQEYQQIKFLKQRKINLKKLAVYKKLIINGNAPLAIKLLDKIDFNKAAAIIFIKWGLDKPFK